MNGLSGNAPARRLSRETRHLLIAVLAALIALWTLARLRFPDTTVTPNPIQPLLKQISSPLGFTELEAQINRAQSRLLPALLPVTIDVGAAAQTQYASLRIGDDIAVTLIAPGTVPVSDEIVAFDRGTGLAVVRAPSPDRPALALPSTTGSFDSSRYLLATQSTANRIWLQPVLLGPLSRQSHAGWSGDVWAVPASTGLTAGSLLFTHEGDLAGGLVRDIAGAVVVPADVLISDAQRLATRGRPPLMDLGIEVQQLSPPLQRATGSDRGVIVAAVRPAVPPAQLRIGDVIEAINDVPIASLRDWQVHAGRVTEARVNLRVRSGGQPATIVITAQAAGLESHSEIQELGLTLRMAAGVGAEVIQVDRRSAAGRAGIRAGDFIVSAGTTRAPAPAQVRRAFRAAEPGSPLLLGLTRDDSHLVVALVK